VQSESHSANLRSYDSNLPEQPAQLRPTTFYLQGDDASLQLAPASTTAKANRANKHESAVLHTAGVVSTGVRPISTKNQRKSGITGNTIMADRLQGPPATTEPTTPIQAREQACLTAGVLRKHYGKGTCLNHRSAPQHNTILQWRDSPASWIVDPHYNPKPTTTSERTGLYYRSAPRQQ
jgi:hypothetical protein